MLSDGVKVSKQHHLGHSLKLAAMSDYSFSGDDELPAATSKPLKAATTSTRGRKPPAAAAAAKTAPAPSTRRAKPAAAAKENPRSPLASNPPTRAAGVRSSGRGTGVGDENHRPDAGAVAAAGGKARGGTAAMNGHAAAGGANNAAAGGGGTHPKFKFAQRIVGGGAITTSELVKRMKELHSQLKAITQEEMADESLRAALMRPKKDLISTSLMMHKDKGVKVLAACSLAEILRLFAPDAPYTEAELRDIFEFFLKQLHNLSDPEHAYFENYHNLLDSLATVKSIILVTDINADELVIQYYKDFFDIVTVDMQKNVYDNILFVLQLLTEENNSISQDVVELIAYQFSHERKKANPRAFTLAVDLCNSCTDKLQKYICQYFSDVFVTASKAGRDGGASIDDFREAHDLVLEMNVHSHGVLLYVVPLLEEELRYDDVEVRRLATEVLGKMIAERGSRLTAAYGPVFRTWLERRNDNQSQIRILWIELCFPILKKHADMFAELIPHVAQKLQDPDEKVRLAVIKMVQALLKERDKKDLEASAWSNLTKDLLVQVGSRCRDKKSNLSVKPDDNYGAEKFGWIPGHLLDLLYLDDAEIKVLVEKSFSEEILPVDTDDAKRTDRLLKVVSAFSERQHAAFVSILERQAK
ncbi:hypothetical protein HK101_003654 [Irineochytrium annulatum]|nr:hypothetical protein HK101_003654 [Irineochytrium annulatum]